METQLADNTDDKLLSVCSAVEKELNLSLKSLSSWQLIIISW